MYKVAICPEDLLQGHDFHIVKLRHPKTQQPSHFAFSQDYTNIQEILVNEPEYGSWFVGSTVSSDGTTLYITRFDPIFLVLPYLLQQHSSNPERFSPLEQILEDEEFPHTRKVCRCSAISVLDSLADMKGSDDYKAYRYNEAKTLKWLQKKVELLMAYLEKSKVHVESGARSSTFIRSSTSECQGVDYKQYAFGIVSDYLPQELSELLRQHLGLPKEVKIMQTEPPNKKSKYNSTSGGPLEDYSKGILTEKQPASDKKLSATQKKLAKIDKTGMKSITSFFALKTKKA